MTFTTLDALKTKMEVSGTADDDPLQMVVDAVNATLTRLTGLDTEGATGRVQTFTRVKVGVLYALERRPVLTATAQGRLRASSTFDTIGLDLIDPDLGTFSVAGTDSFPPQAQPAPWYGWRSSYWEVVRVTYDTDVYVPPDDLTNAATAWALWLYQREALGPSTASGSLHLMEQYQALDMPQWVRAVVEGYYPRVPRVA